MERHWSNEARGMKSPALPGISTTEWSRPPYHPWCELSIIGDRQLTSMLSH